MQVKFEAWIVGWVWSVESRASVERGLQVEFGVWIVG